MTSAVPHLLRRLLRLGLGAGLLLLAACGPATVNSNVLRFHAMASAPRGGSFAIVPEGEQEGRLEFKAYAAQVARELERRGYTPAAEKDKADLVVSLHYAVDDGRTEIWTTPIYSYNDYWRRYYGAQAAWPQPFTDPIGVDTHSTTYFTHRLELRILDGALYRKGKRESLFEGRAISERTTRELAVTIPYLVTALFDDFPGQSGVPTTVRLQEKPAR